MSDDTIVLEPQDPDLRFARLHAASGDHLADWLEAVAKRLRGVPEERIAARLHWRNDIEEDTADDDSIIKYRPTGGYSYDIEIHVAPPGSRIIARGCASVITEEEA